MNKLVKIAEENLYYTNGHIVSYCAPVDSTWNYVSGMSMYVLYLADIAGRSTKDGEVKIQPDMKVALTSKEMPVVVAGRMQYLDKDANNISLPVLIKTSAAKLRSKEMRPVLQLMAEEALTAVKNNCIASTSTVSIEWTGKWSVSRDIWYDIRQQQSAPGWPMCLMLEL